MPFHEWTPGNRIAGLVLFVAVLACAAAFGTILRSEPASVDAHTTNEAEIPPVVRPPGITHAQLLATIDRNPFHPDRRRPDGRYSLEAAGGHEAAPAHSPRSDGIRLRLLGTTMFTDGSGFALIEQFGEPARLLHVGGRWGELKLDRVERGGATVTVADSTFVLRLPPPGN